MSEEKKKTVNHLIPKPGYLLIQLVMLFLQYGLKYDMPWWVVWFPSIVYLIVIVVVLIILLGGIIIAAIMD